MTLTQMVDIIEQPMNSKPLRQRLKALTQMWILEDRKDLLNKINDLYNSIIEHTNYPKAVLETEMKLYKQKLILQRELNDTCKLMQNQKSF